MTETLLTPFADAISCQRMGIRVSPKDKLAFAKKLKAWRKSKALSQSGAAKFLNISVRTLQNWEIARTKPSATACNLLLAIIAPTGKRR